MASKSLNELTLAMLAGLLKKGVEVRLIHAKEPETAWREAHEKHPIFYDGMERVLCPRVHFKLIIIDTSIAYIGSANLTGAGMGMKSPRKRNFEAGILTDDPEMVEAAIEQFDNVWIGKFFASSSINAARIMAVESIVQTR
jgi:phosphatidylserine/phosphatidylglycerophosphate/cardiolipin synthase-like enzyme